ncbi:MAG: SMP-30/gluconolactonase/LRE family protein [Coriobacteriia bacterium]|nr:SMP-30/gluconolactonase/LRE family protein [Coriobacteriia bacterium]
MTEPTLDDMIDSPPDAAPGDGSAGRGRFALTPRRAFALLAVVLAIILVALIVYLLWFLGRPEVLTSRAVVQGVQPVWQVYGPGEGEQPLFDRPMGVAVGPGNRIYVTDGQNNRVCAFDSQGRFLFEFGGFGIAKPAPGAKSTYEPGLLNYPVGIDTDSEGNVYVASFRNDTIEVFDSEGAALRQFPDPQVPTGKGSSGYMGGGIAVTDVAVNGDRIYATDAYQVFVFTLEGELLDQWGKPGIEPGDLDHPNGIAVSRDGKVVYVSDSNHNRVTAFAPDGAVLWQVGEISGGIEDKAAREIELPRGLSVLSDGSVLVADAFAFTLVRISAQGEIIGRYGERGVDPGQFNFSNDVESFRGFVAVADKENGRLQVIRLVD